MAKSKKLVDYSKVSLSVLRGALSVIAEIPHYRAWVDAHDFDGYEGAEVCVVGPLCPSGGRLVVEGEFLVLNELRPDMYAPSHQWKFRICDPECFSKLRDELVSVVEGHRPFNSGFDPDEIVSSMMGDE